MTRIKDVAAYSAVLTIWIVYTLELGDYLTIMGATSVRVSNCNNGKN